MADVSMFWMVTMVSVAIMEVYTSGHDLVNNKWLWPCYWNPFINIARKGKSNLTTILMDCQKIYTLYNQL